MNEYSYESAYKDLDKGMRKKRRRNTYLKNQRLKRIAGYRPWALCSSLYYDKNKDRVTRCYSQAFNKTFKRIANRKYRHMDNILLNGNLYKKLYCG